METRNQQGAFPIDNRGYLGIRNVDIVRNDICIYDNAFLIVYDDLNGAFNGNLYDRKNNGINFISLRDSINLLFNRAHVHSKD